MYTYVRYMYTYVTVLFRNQLHTQKFCQKPKAVILSTTWG